jgi:hypothetical protein
MRYPFELKKEDRRQNVPTSKGLLEQRTSTLLQQRVSMAKVQLLLQGVGVSLTLAALFRLYKEIAKVLQFSMHFPLFFLTGQKLISFFSTMRLTCVSCPCLQRACMLASCDILPYSNQSLLHACRLQADGGIPGFPQAPCVQLV